MTLTAQDLEKISQLAYLATDNEQAPQLIEDLNIIMNFVEQLRSVDTQGIEPLFHPIALHQRLRVDEVTEENCVHALKTLAPKFDGDLYLVPQVIDQSN